MTCAENLRAILQDVQVSGKSDQTTIKAVLSILVQMADRLEAVEKVCKSQHPGK